ncbi:MAG: MGDG synthase family glycosyltransferase [Anaerolineae bacterium]
MNLHDNRSIDEPARILILTADAGFGHRAAANAIAQALAERYGNACQVTVLNPLQDPRAPGLLRRAQGDYDRWVKQVPELYKFGYEASDGTLPVSLAEQALIALLYFTMRDVVGRYRPHVIVTTYPLYQAPLAAYFALSGKYVPLLTVVTDLVTVHSLWFNEDVDKCLVPTTAVLKKALESGLPPDRLEVTGLPVNPALARPVDKAALRAQLGFQEGRYVVLLVGSKRVKNLEPIACVLDHCGLPLELVLVAGGDEALYQRWSGSQWHQPAHVHHYVTDMPSLMLAGDLIVCKAGGLIVSESLAAGLPLLIAEAIPGQETGNAVYVVEGGAGVLVKDAVEALVHLFHWLDRNAAELKERAAHAQRLGRPEAAYRVADLVWEASIEGAGKRQRRLDEQRSFLSRLLKDGIRID